MFGNHSELLIECYGIVASILVALSLTMRNIKMLRIINLIGSFAFALYGILISSIAIVLLNLFTVGVNVYYLVKLYKEAKLQNIFDIMFLENEDDMYTHHFIAAYKDDIGRFFPSFSAELEKDSFANLHICFILRRTLPVSLVVFRHEPNEEITIVLDYAIPDYRDFKNAQFFFESAISRIASPGTILNAVGEVPAHCKYLRRMGFTEVSGTETPDISVKNRAVRFRKIVGEA
ncbi:MAG: hypothetical protein LBQ88_03725 [Treponema sp.]|jgi:hypothetical protein|nr:hypothetical protein [Treponema sp.]